MVKAKAGLIAEVVVINAHKISTKKENKLIIPVILKGIDIIIHVTVQY